MREKLFDASFSLPPLKIASPGVIAPKLPHSPLPHDYRKVRRDGDFFAYVYGKIGVEPCVGRLSGSKDQCFRSSSGSMGKWKRVATDTEGGGSYRDKALLHITHGKDPSSRD